MTAGGEVLLPVPARNRLAGALAATDSLAAEEALQNIARLFEIVRAQSALLADDRASSSRGTSRRSSGGRRSGDGRARPGGRRGRSADGPQGEGPRIPGRLPVRPRRRPLPGSTGGIRWRSRGAASTRAAGEAIQSPGGAPPLLRRHDPCARRADPQPRRGLWRSRSRRVSPFVLEALDLPVAAGIAGRGRPRRGSAGADRRVRAAHRRPGAATRADDGPLTLSFGADRRLPDLPAQVPLPPRPAGAGRAAPCDDLRVGAPQGGPGVPSPPCARRRDERDRAHRRVRGCLARTRASSPVSTRRRASRPAGTALRRFRAEQLQPGAVIPAYVEREFAFSLGGDRIRGRWDRVDIEPARRRGTDAALGGAVGPTSTAAAIAVLAPDVITTRCHCCRGAGDDHRLQVERRSRSCAGAAAGPRFAPADDLRDGLPGTDGTTAGRGPAALPRHRARRPGRVDDGAWPRPEPRSPRPRPGSGLATSRQSRTRSPAPTARSVISVPSSVARRRRKPRRCPGRSQGDHLDFGNTLVPVSTPHSGAWSRTRPSRSAAGAGRSTGRVPCGLV